MRSMLFGPAVVAAAALVAGGCTVTAPPSVAPLTAASAPVVPPPKAPPPDPIAGQLTEFARGVSEAQLRADVERLVSIGTRHTLSSQTHPTRGIGAALNWTEAEFKRYSAACRGCLQVGRASQVMEGRRLTGPTRITNVFALQRGTERPNDVVIITGHIDSRVTDVMNATADAPGANDDGSGTAAAIEAARVLSKHRFPATIVYAALSGEEQGLYGGKVMADYAKSQGWNVIANLNNDIIGNSCGSDGVCDPNTVRVFSEGPRWQGREELAGQIRSLGGENDSPSRNLSRFLDTLAERVNLGLDVRQIWRNDRFGRGGDHTEFLDSGYPAIRFSVSVENYNHQHQDLRVENGVEYGDTVDKMDFPYLAKVVRLNVAALAALASAPPPPEAKAEGAVKTDTTVSWATAAEDRATYRVYRRRTDAANWQNSAQVARGNSESPPLVCSEMATRVRPSVGFSCTLKGIRVDDWVFGVSSVSTNGYESAVAGAVPGGAFKPYVAPPAEGSTSR